MQVHGILHQNERPGEPPVRVRQLSLAATDCCDERVLALIARAVGEGGHIEVKLNSQLDTHCFSYAPTVKESQ